MRQPQQFPRKSRVYHKSTLCDGTVVVTLPGKSLVAWDEGQEFQGEHWVDNRYLAQTAEELARLHAIEVEKTRVIGADAQKVTLEFAQREAARWSKLARQLMGIEE